MQSLLSSHRPQATRKPCLNSHNRVHGHKLVSVEAGDCSKRRVCLFVCKCSCVWYDGMVRNGLVWYGLVGWLASWLAGWLAGDFCLLPGSETGSELTKEMQPGLACAFSLSVCKRAGVKGNQEPSSVLGSSLGGQTQLHLQSLTWKMLVVPRAPKLFALVLSIQP